MKIKNIGYLFLLLLLACKPELPVTSSITIDLGKLSTSINPDLYGLTIEEINHALEGGLYAEMIQNRSFEEGIIPAGCQYDASNNCLITPSGWKVPFVNPNIISGWRTLSEQTTLAIDTRNPVNETNKHSLLVHIAFSGKGGVVAEGFHGIAIQKGEQYDLSLFIKGNKYTNITVELRDSMAYMPLSESYQVHLSPDWTRVRHTFTAIHNAKNATLVFSTDDDVSFNLDIVSLFPQKTWQKPPNCLRADLMEALEALNPKFIRFPGGVFSESYTMEEIPKWDETIGPTESRKSMWSIWGYGTSNGIGFHEYLQLCESLNAYPIYVMNAGILNQRYYTVLDEMKNMDSKVQSLKGALLYANEPNDSIYGQIRATNGHATPFNLQTIELGSENRGKDYATRYQYLRHTLKDAFPYLKIICNDIAVINNFREDWIDTHYNIGVDYLISHHNCFDIDNLTLHKPLFFVGEFGAGYSSEGGTLRAAVGEAAFLIGTERNPMNMKGVSYSPLLGHTSFPSNGVAAIEFDASRIVKSPSYYVLEMFANNRGDELLVTNVNTYKKPLVNSGFVSAMLFDNLFEVKDLMLDDKIISSRDELPKFTKNGDPTRYNYSFSAKIKPEKEGGKIQLRVRDNGLNGEQSDYLSLTIKDSTARLFHCAGNVELPLTLSTPLFLEEEHWYTVKIVCKNEQIRCYIDEKEILEASVPIIPSLIAITTREESTKTLILKVVNTTFHEEWTSLHFTEGNIEDEAEVIQLTGKSDIRNTLDNPNVIVPERKKIKFSIKKPITYAFPANSVSIIRMKIK